MRVQGWKCYIASYVQVKVEGEERGEHWHGYLNHNHAQVGCTLLLQLFSSDGPVLPCIDVSGLCSEQCHRHSRVCQSVYR